MLTINFNTIAFLLWQILIVMFHLTRIAIIVVLGMSMSLFAMMRFQDNWGILIMFIIIISITDWLMGVYLKDLFKR